MNTYKKINKIHNENMNKLRWMLIDKPKETKSYDFYMLNMFANCCNCNVHETKDGKCSDCVKSVGTVLENMRHYLAINVSCPPEELKKEESANEKQLLYFKNEAGVLNKKTGLVEIGNKQKNYSLEDFKFILLSNLCEFTSLNIKEINDKIYSGKYLAIKNDSREPLERLKRLRDNIVRDFNLQEKNNPVIKIKIKKPNIFLE